MSNKKKKGHCKKPVITPRNAGFFFQKQITGALEEKKTKGARKKTASLKGSGTPRAEP